MISFSAIALPLVLAVMGIIVSVKPPPKEGCSQSVLVSRIVAPPMRGKMN
jgi:hypothetical protein